VLASVSSFPSDKALPIFNCQLPIENRFTRSNSYNRQSEIGNRQLHHCRSTIGCLDKSSGCGEYIKPIDEKETLVWFR
jgi:hypothetical protein